MDFSIQLEWNFHLVIYTNNTDTHNENGRNVLKNTAQQQLNEAGFKEASILLYTYGAFSNSHLFDAIVVYINTYEIIKNYDYVYTHSGGSSGV